jgi:UDP-glucose 4-epimerase
MERIVISGASSMLGIALINECIEKDIEVLAIVRENSIKTNNIPKSKIVTILECDLENLNSLEIENMLEYNIFYHLAWAKTSNSSRDNISAHIHNIQYTIDAVELASKLGCKTFIGAGSQAEYGIVDHTISPGTSCNPENAYGIAKYAAGKLSKVACSNIGIRHIWARIFSVYGPNNNNETMVMYIIGELLAGRKPTLTKCEQLWDYLYCDDAARALYLLGEKGKRDKIYCIGSGEGKLLLQYVEIIRDLIDPKLPLGIGEKEYIGNQVVKLLADITDLKKDTGFTPRISFEKGIMNTIEWVKNHKNVREF